MAATKWKRLRVNVDLAVRDGCVTEKDLRWAVETALTSSRTADEVLRSRQRIADRPVYVRNLTVRCDRTS